MRKYNDWEEIDKDTNGLVTSLTYMVLFVNDQVYNYTVSLMEAIRNSEHYRHNAKRTANAIEREINAYNTNIFRIAKANKDALAEITQSMEEDVQPHIDRLSNEVTGRDVRINLNEQPGIVKAFTAISNALLRPEVFEKTFEKAG